MSLFDHDLQKTLIYSSSDITISELRENNYDISRINTKKYDTLRHWCQENLVLSATQEDSQYHYKFSLIYSAPYVISWIGDIDLLNRNLLAIVGPRRPSLYANQILEDIFGTIKHYDLVTISGMAPGVDMMTHEFSLQHQIPTIAVLGGGLRRFLQSKSRDTIRKIVSGGGLVVSEFRLDQSPERYTFPQRNRIVAGLSEMVFLPEAGEKSGSLITADFARHMHKDVYGAPGSVFSPSSAGLLHYMEQGHIRPISHWETMLNKYFGKKTTTHQQSVSSGEDNSLSGEVSSILDILQKSPTGLGLNELVSQTGLSIEEIMSQLSIGEILGQVRNDGGAWRVY